MDGKKIKLAYPISADGSTVDSLRLRRPKVRDRLAVEKMSVTEVEKEVWFIAHLCEMAPEQIEELDMADYFKIQEALADFFA